MYAFVSLSACLLQPETQNAHCTITVRTFWFGLKDEIRSQVQVQIRELGGVWSMRFLTKIEVNVCDSFPPGLVCRHADSVHILGVSCDSGATCTCRHAPSRCSCLGLFCRGAVMEHLPSVWLVWADSEVKASSQRS